MLEWDLPADKEKTKMYSCNLPPFSELTITQPFVSFVLQRPAIFICYLRN